MTFLVLHTTDFLFLMQTYEYVFRLCRTRTTWNKLVWERDSFGAIPEWKAVFAHRLGSTLCFV